MDSKDQYDLAIEYLTVNPNEIYTAWNNPSRHNVAGCLFKMVGDCGGRCGCLTQIALGKASACSEELTTLIRSEQRLAVDVVELENSKEGRKAVASTLLPLLPLFAEYQRIVDKKTEQLGWKSLRNNLV